MENQIIQLFQEWSGESLLHSEMLPIAGSDRRYYRLKSANFSTIACKNEDENENEIFIRLSDHFLSTGTPIPEVFCASEDKKIYLQQDLGNQSLLEHLIENRDEYGNPNPNSIQLYKDSLAALAHLQLTGIQNTPVQFEQFEAKNMIFDLHYFKYYFVKAQKLAFDERKLEDEFIKITAWLNEADAEYLLYRDFQARNIMILENKPYFIDFQGAKSGPLAYDVASLLFQAKAELSPEIREELLFHYLEVLSKLDSKINTDLFLKHYYGFVLMRLLQVLGSYGFRGLFEGRKHFLESIPYGLKNLKWWMDSVTLPFEIPELRKIAEKFTI
jgi:aminoglycoside/choline kinase family phosphotransferase